jgi:hypothetical protein
LVQQQVHQLQTVVPDTGQEVLQVYETEGSMLIYRALNYLFRILRRVPLDRATDVTFP